MLALRHSKALRFCRRSGTSRMATTAPGLRCSREQLNTPWIRPTLKPSLGVISIALCTPRVPVLLIRHGFHHLSCHHTSFIAHVARVCARKHYSALAPIAHTSCKLDCACMQQLIGQCSQSHRRSLCRQYTTRFASARLPTRAVLGEPLLLPTLRPSRAVAPIASCVIWSRRGAVASSNLAYHHRSLQVFVRRLSDM